MEKEEIIKIVSRYTDSMKALASKQFIDDLKDLESYNVNINNPVETAKIIIDRTITASSTILCGVLCDILFEQKDD